MDKVDGLINHEPILIVRRSVFFNSEGENAISNVLTFVSSVCVGITKNKSLEIKYRVVTLIVMRVGLPRMSRSFLSNSNVDAGRGLKFILYRNGRNKNQEDSWMGNAVANLVL